MSENGTGLELLGFLGGTAKSKEAEAQKKLDQYEYLMEKGELLTDIRFTQEIKDKGLQAYDGDVQLIMPTEESTLYKGIFGSTYLLDGIDENGGIKQETEDLVMNDLRGHFRPEFLNRLDEIILFKPLTKDNIGNIIHLLIADVNRRLADKELQVRLTDAAESYITEHGFDPMYGARPLKRYVQKTVETLAAKLILKGDINTGDDIVIDVVNGELTARAEGRKAIEEK